MKYRIRLKNGRVLGPFVKDDFHEIADRGEITGNEEVQIFPTGEWKPLAEYPELIEKLEGTDDVTSERDETFIQNIKREIEGSSVAEENPAYSEHKEFKYDINQGEDPETPLEANDKEEEAEKAPSDEEELDKTLIRKLPDLDSDKTKVNLDYRKYLEEQKKQQELEEQKRLEEEKRRAFEKELEEDAPDFENDKTQIFSISEVGKELNEALEIELELEEDEKKSKLKKKKQKIKKNSEALISQKPNKKYKLYAIVAAAIIAIFMMDDGEDKNKLGQIKIIPPKIEFPPRAVGGDPQLAKALFKEGLSLERKQTYFNDLRAVSRYKKSMLNKYDGNPAAPRLIFLYADSLRNSQNFDFDANKVYNLVQYFQEKLYVDPAYASAGAYFYYTVGKINAALNILDRYKLLEGDNKTARLFAVYLRVLTKNGNLIEAQKIAQSLDSKKEKDLFTLISLYEFSKANSNNEKAFDYIKYATANFPNSAYFLGEKAELFLAKEDLEEVREILFRLNKINVEGSSYFYSKYLKIKGFYHAQKKEFKKATEELKKSLKLYPDSTLLGKLAMGEQTDDMEINDLFETSKASVLVKRSKQYLQEKDLDQAFKLAVQAAEASKNNVEARLNLAEIQIEKGYYDDALFQMKKLYDENRANIDVQYALVSTYIDMFKFNEANQLLDLIEDKTTERYASAKAALYLKRRDYNLANGWLTKAINLNKLNEENIYKLAKLRILYHKYDRAKSTLSRAMDLDPYNIDYKLSFARILYEVENSKAAIGYLYDVLKSFPDNIRILSEIGIYYYRSGQIKNYQNIKKKIQSLPGNSLVLNRFLLESAKLDDSYPDIIKYCRKIIQDDPGDLETRLYLAQILMEMKKFKESKAQLEEIEKRFKTYPKLAYFNARFYLLIKDIKTAISLGEKEIKENPGVVDGYLLLGSIYQDEKDLLKARDYFQKAAQVDANNVDAILGLAFVAFHRDQYDMALDQYQRAATMDPNRAEIYKLLGDTYRKIGQGQIAIKNYKQYLELSPNSRYKSSIESYIKTME